MQILLILSARFLLAQLHMDSLRDKTSAKSVKKALENLPEGADCLDLAYDGALQRVENQRDGFRLLAKQLLGWVTYSARLMTVTEIQHALAIEPGTSELDEENLSDVDEIAGFCAGLVIVDEGTQCIRLVHYTTQEYFRRNGNSILPSAQQDIAVRCLTYLLYDQFQDGWVSEAATEEDNDEIGPEKDDGYQRTWKGRQLSRLGAKLARRLFSRSVESRIQKYPFLDYAARYWADHAVACGQREIMELMIGFAKADRKVSSARQVILVLDKKHKLLGDIDGTMTRSPLTAMHLIAYLGDEQAMLELLNQGFEVSAMDSNHRVPLWWAALQGHQAAVDLLLSQKNVSVNSRGFFYNGAGDQLWTETPLGVAAFEGEDKIVERLIEREDVDVNLPGDYSGSPLLSAAQGGFDRVVELLLTRKDIEIDSRDLYGRTPLWYAADYGQEKIVKQLLNREDIQVNFMDKNGRSPLATAAHQGHEGVVMILLGHADIDVNTRDVFGDAPLLNAAYGCHEAVMKLLLSHAQI